MSDRIGGGETPEGPRIRVSNHGPYVVSGGPQLTTRTPVLDAHGDAVAWAEGPVHKASATYVLCTGLTFAEATDVIVIAARAANAATHPSRRKTRLAPSPPEPFMAFITHPPS